MQITNIKFMDEVTDINCDNVDVCLCVRSENGYTYTLVVGTPTDLIDKMDQEKMNFVEPGLTMIVVKQLTEEIVEESIKAYAEDNAYWLELHQFADEIDISVLDKLEAEHREEWELFYLEGLDRVFYYIQKYLGIVSENRVLLSRMVLFTVVSSVAYCVLKPGFLDLFSNIIH